MNGRPRVFYGWWVVLASAFGLLLGPVPILIFSFGVFLKPLAAEFHSGRGTISLAVTLHNTIDAFAIGFAGRMVDRFGARRVILPSMMLSGLILLSASYCSGSIWRLYAFFLAAGVVNSGAAPVSFANLISHWFDKRRGLALGAMSVGMGAGAFFMPSIAQHLIARFGWRFAYGAVGAGILLITVPVLSLLLKDRPEHKTLLPGGAITALEGESDGSTLPEAWRTRTFWVLPSACVIVAASMYACFAHVPAILTDRGISPRNAALASSLFGAGTLAGRAGSGYLLDRFFAPRVAALIFGCAAAGIVVLGTTSSQELAWMAAFIMGIGWGGRSRCEAVYDWTLFWTPLIRRNIRGDFWRLSARRRAWRLSDGSRFRCDAFV